MSQASAPAINSPKSTRSAHTLTALFLALSFLVSLAFLSVRNIYDDENSSLEYVNRSVAQIVHTANSADVHPPGMYLLAHFAYQAIPSPRWMTIFSLLALYAGLSVFVFAVAPLFATTRARVCFLLLATLHPQLLMWGNTIRWYGWWTGLALLTLTFALQPASSALTPRLTPVRALLLGLLLTGLFYLNYITLIFIVALGLAMLLRYSWRIWKQPLLTFAVFLPLIAPQLHAFLTVHLAGSRGQRSSFLLSLARLVEATFCSEAFLPWHPLAILVALAFVFLPLLGIRQAVRLLRAPAAASALCKTYNGLASIVLFSLAFFMLVALSGLGGKPRNGLLLLPVLAPLIALLLDTLRPISVQYAFIGLFGLWSAVGVEHLLRREGLTKSNMNNRPEQVASFVRDSRGADCSVVVTYDALLTLDLSTSDLPRLLILTPFQNSVYQRTRPFNPTQCQRMDLYLVQSYTGGLGIDGAIVTAEMEAEARTLPGPFETHPLSFDPDAARKRRLTFISGASDLPDYRYVVTSTAVAPSSLNAIRRELPHFTAADGQSKAVDDLSAPAQP
jgi:hypothetical protein